MITSLLFPLPDTSPGVLSFLLVVSAFVLGIHYRRALREGRPVLRRFPDASRQAQIAAAASRVLSALVMSRAARQEGWGPVLVGAALWFLPIALLALEPRLRGTQGFTAQRREAALATLWHLAHMMAVARNGDLSAVSCPECRRNTLRLVAVRFQRLDGTGTGALWCTRCRVGIELNDDLMPDHPEMVTAAQLPAYTRRPREE